MTGDWKKLIIDVGCGPNELGDVNVDMFRGRGFNRQTGDQDRGEYMDPKKIQNYVCADALRLPFKDGAFDTAFSSHLIEHLANPEAFMAELARVSTRKIVLRYPHARGSGAIRPFHVSLIDERRIAKAASCLGLSSEQFVRSRSLFSDRFSGRFKPRFPPYRLLRGVERRLVRRGLLRPPPFEVEARIGKRDPTDSEKVFFVVPVNDDAIYDGGFGSSSFVEFKPSRFVVKCYNNEGGLASLYNLHGTRAEFADYWFAFCHQDFKLDEDLALRLKGKDRRTVYGVIGANAGAGKLFGRIKQTDGSFVGLKVADTYPVQTLDEMCLIVHSSLFAAGLRFDPAFRFHFYGADLCLSAFKLGFGVSVLQTKCQHKSRTLKGDVKSLDYLATKRFFAEKWSRFFPIRTTTTSWERGL